MRDRNGVTSEADCTAHPCSAVDSARSESTRPMLKIENVRHHYGAVQALRGVSLTATKGEFLTILGESGSGKTTLLRMISGLEQPTAVDCIEIDGMNVADVPAAQRNCTTVFQNYALFPHMSVRENVEYGLSVRGVKPDERKRRAIEALDLVRLEGKSERRISQLSGGERQRVALARALVTRPAILLLDEPLGALDEKLRQQMQEELVALHRQLGMTFIYITHSQEEALTLSDRIVLMSRGQVVQSGTPEILFDRPNSRFSADFMGFENMLSGKLCEIGHPYARVSLGNTPIHGVWSDKNPPEIGQSVLVALRAERVGIGEISDAGDDFNTLSCTAGECLYRGKYMDRTVETEFGPVRARIWDRSQQLSDCKQISWRFEDCVILTQSL